MILNKLNFKTPQEIIGQAIRILLSFIGSIGLIFYIYAGILWMTAAGNSEQVTKAKQVLVWTTLGIAMMLLSYIVIKLVFGIVLTGSTP